MCLAQSFQNSSLSYDNIIFSCITLSPTSNNVITLQQTILKIKSNIVNHLTRTTMAKQNIMVPTLISPDLILSIAPTSSTGVIPLVFFSSNGPISGLLIPIRCVSPRSIREQRRINRSTNFNGNHFNSHIDNEKVD